MQDFSRERQLYSLAISPQFVPMMYFCEEGGAEGVPPFVVTERGDFTLGEVNVCMVWWVVLWVGGGGWLDVAHC